MVTVNATRIQPIRGTQSNILVEDESAWFSQNGGGLTRLDLKTGAVLARNLNYDFRGLMVPYRGNVLCLDSREDQSRVAALVDGETLVPIWEIEFSRRRLTLPRKGGTWNPMYLYRDRLLSIKSVQDPNETKYSYFLDCIDLDSGTAIWSVPWTWENWGISATEKVVAIPDHQSKNVKFLDMNTGLEIKEWPLASNIEFALSHALGSRLAIFEFSRQKGNRIGTISRVKLFDHAEPGLLYDIRTPDSENVVGGYLAEDGVYLLTGSVSEEGYATQLEKAYIVHPSSEIEELALPPSLSQVYPGNQERKEWEGRVFWNGRILDPPGSLEEELETGIAFDTSGSPISFLLSDTDLDIWRSRPSFVRRLQNLNDGKLEVTSKRVSRNENVIFVEHDSDIGRWVGYSQTSSYIHYEAFGYDKDHLVLATNYPYLECLDRKTGRSLWIYQFPSPWNNARSREMEKKFPPRDFRTVSDLSLLEDHESIRESIGSGPLATNLHKDTILYKRRSRKRAFALLVRIAGAAVILSLGFKAYRKYGRRQGVPNEKPS